MLIRNPFGEMPYPEYSPDLMLSKFKYNKKVMGYLLIAVCVLIVVRHVYMHREELNQLSHFSALHIGLWILCQVSFTLVTGVKMLIVHKGFGLKDISLIKWLKIFFISRFIASNVSQGGKVYRYVVLKNLYGFSFTKSIGVSAFLLWYEAVFSMGMLVLFLLAYRQPFILRNVNILNIILPLWLLCLCGPFVGSMIVTRLPGKGERMEWIRRKFDELTMSFRQITKSPAFFAILLMWSALNFAILCTAMYIFFHGLGIMGMTFIQTGLFSATIISSNILSVTPNNVGIMELIIGLLGETIGVTLANTIVASGGLRILMYVITAVVTLILSKFIEPDLQVSEELAEK